MEIIEFIGVPGIAWVLISLIGLPVVLLFIEGEAYNRLLLPIIAIALPTGVVLMIMGDLFRGGFFVVLGVAVSYWFHHNKRAKLRRMGIL